MHTNIKLLVMSLFFLFDQIYAMGAQIRADMISDRAENYGRYSVRQESAQEREERKQAEKLQRQKEARNNLIQKLLFNIKTVNDLDELNAYALQGILLHSLDLVKAAIKKGASNFQVFYLFAKENNKQELLPFLATEFIKYRQKQDSQLTMHLPINGVRLLVTSYIYLVSEQEEQAVKEAARKAESSCSLQ